MYGTTKTHIIIPAISVYERIVTHVIIPAIAVYETTVTHVITILFQLLPCMRQQ